MIRIIEEHGITVTVQRRNAGTARHIVTQRIGLNLGGQPSHIPDRKSGTTTRSQAYETLGAMTTIIMRTSHDNCDRLFSALFQGFLSLGNLSVTLIFHEAPTGTRK